MSDTAIGSSHGKLPRPPREQLRLFVNDSRLSSTVARAVLEAAIDRLGSRFALEIIDVAFDPQRAEMDGILATPVLM